MSLPILLSLLVVLLLLLQGAAHGFSVDAPRSVSPFAWTKTTTMTPSSFAWLLPVWRRPSFLCASRPKDQQQQQQEQDKEASSLDSPPTRRSVWLSLEECLALHQNNNKQNVHFVDGSWYHKGHRSGREEFEKGPRIAGAHYFDLSVLVDDASTPIPLQLPSPALLQAALQDMGILLSFSTNNKESDEKKDAVSTTNTTTTVVVVYGRQGALFLPRVWFTLDQFFSAAQPRDGCYQQEVSVYLMQASLEEWIEAGGPVETDFQSVHDDEYRIEPVPPLDDNDYRKNVVVSLDKVQQFLQKPEDCIFVDARGSSFQQGHMPGAIHIPYSSLLRHTKTTASTTTNDSMAFLEPSQLQAVFAQAGVDVHDPRPIICTCGSGISACSLYLGLQECGRRRTAAPTFLYDGSWQEYKRQPDDTCPKVMGSSKAQAS